MSDVVCWCAFLFPFLCLSLRVICTWQRHLHKKRYKGKLNYFTRWRICMNSYNVNLTKQAFLSQSKHESPPLNITVTGHKQTEQKRLLPWYCVENLLRRIEDSYLFYFPIFSNVNVLSWTYSHKEQILCFSSSAFCCWYEQTFLLNK